MGIRSILTMGYDKTIPFSMFPQSIDDISSLYEVFNTSEAKLIQDFVIQDDILYIKPREWNEPRRWSHNGGFINIEGELIYYKDVNVENSPNPPTTGSTFSFFEDPTISADIKAEYQRVIAFKNLVRISGFGTTGIRSHFVGEWVRGYVMAEHHNALRQAILGIETLIGIDNSTDHTSVDYRLRDLADLNVEKDDTNCPYGIYWYKILEDNESSQTVQFFINIIGDYDSFSLLPENGAIPINNDFSPIYTYNKINVNPDTSHNTFITNSSSPAKASLTVNYKNCCSCLSSSDVICEPCEFEPVIPDIPTLTCPQIIIPEVPQPVFECPEITCDVATFAPCTTTNVSPTVTTIVVTGITEINVNIPEITIPPFNSNITVDINVNWLGAEDENNAEGACFRLIPCQSTTS
jgi:hypothetical protein